MREVKFNVSLLKSLKSKSRKLADERNLLTHGCWTKHPKFGWMVRETRGEWEQSNDGPSGTRKIMPESIPRDQTNIAGTVTKLDSLIDEMLAFKQSLQ